MAFGRVCEACYMYHRFCDLWLLPMKRILRLMFNVAMPFLFYNVEALDTKFGPYFRHSNPRFAFPWDGAGFSGDFRAWL